MMIVQTLNEEDYQQRSAFAELMLEIIEEHEDAIMMMSDEAHFHLNGPVNKQNSRYWAAQNSHEVHERPLHSPKVTVWCAVGVLLVKLASLVRTFLEENGITTTVNGITTTVNGITTTVSSARYIDMVNSFFGTRTTEPKD